MPGATSFHLTIGSFHCYQIDPQFHFPAAWPLASLHISSVTAIEWCPSWFLDWKMRLFTASSLLPSFASLEVFLNGCSETKVCSTPYCSFTQLLRKITFAIGIVQMQMVKGLKQWPIPEYSCCKTQWLSFWPFIAPRINLIENMIGKE